MSSHHRPLIRSALARWTGTALVAALLIPVGAHQAAAATTTLYAAPTGSGATCTITAPCSLSGARQLVRTLAPTMSGDITVDLRGGTYQLASALAFTPADSGTGGHTVAWRGPIPARSRCSPAAGSSPDGSSLTRPRASTAPRSRPGRNRASCSSTASAPSGPAAR